MRAFPIIASLLVTAAAPAVPSYRPATSIAGPDGAGWDYANVDPAHRKLFVAHGDAVTEIDLAHGNAARSIGSISRGHAVVPVPRTDWLAVTSGKDSTVRLIDIATGEQRASLQVPEDPDAAVIDPATGHLLTMNAHAGSVSEINIGSQRVVRTISVKPGLEYAAVAPGHMLFVNDEDANEIETVDLTAGKAIGAIALPGCEGPSGLALDAAHHRLVSACANGKAAIVDIVSRKLVNLVDIGRGPDAVIIDEKRQVALIPCGRDGVLDVLSLDGSTVRHIAKVPTEVGARTGALDPATGIVYLPTARFAPASKPGARPQAIPGSFHILVLRPA